MQIHSSLTLFHEEFAVFLGQDNMQMIMDLTAWYDSAKNPWTHRTISGSTQSIVGVWLNILGAITPDLLKSYLPLEAIGGGLVARLLFIYAPRKGKKVPDDFESKSEGVLREALLSDLMNISMLGGPFKVSPQALDQYNDWYWNFDEVAECQDNRFEGYFNRKATTLVKLSMILSASRCDDKVISSGDIQRALGYLQEVEEVMYWSLQGIGKNQFADVMSKIMSELIRLKECNLSHLMYKFRDDVTRFELDKIIQSLETMRFCKIWMGSGKVVYNEEFQNGKVPPT